MHYKEFDVFYNEVIKKYLVEIEEESKKMDNCLKILHNRRDRIYQFYQEKRKYIRNNYMSKDVSALDGHKVAACFIYAILKSKIIRVNRRHKNLPIEMLLANEYLAFYVAINIIDMYKREKDRNDEYSTVIPITYHSGEKMEFVDNLCKGLFYIENIECFDVFAYSTILFLLEKYTDLSIMKDKDT